MIGRAAMFAAVLSSALLVQTVLLANVAVAGWRPDLVTLTVVGFALADGPETGARYGFAAGLAVDLLSSGAWLVGLTALPLLLIGDAVGRARRYVTGTAVVVGDVVLAAAASGAGFALYVLLAVLLELRQVPLLTVVQGTVAMTLWGALLGPLVCRPLALLSRRYSAADPAATSAGTGGRAW